MENFDIILIFIMDEFSTLTAFPAVIYLLFIWIDMFFCFIFQFPSFCFFFYILLISLDILLPEVCFLFLLLWKESTFLLHNLFKNSFNNYFISVHFTLIDVTFSFPFSIIAFLSSGDSSISFLIFSFNHCASILIIKSKSTYLSLL